LGFENVELCRNCGYRFSLTAAPPTPDLTLRTSRAEVRPLDDLTLIDNALQAADEREQRERAAAQSVATVAGFREPDELPLFGGPAPEHDEPLITRASTPRPPLAVRRSTPEMPRLKTERPSLLDFSVTNLDPTPTLLRTTEPRVITEVVTPRVLVPQATRTVEATLAQRYAAAAIDAGIIALTDLLIVYVTMQLCGLLLGDIDLIPRAPLAGFLVAQNVAYFIVFTAGGQTPGKMFVGLRIVEEGSDRSPSLTHAALRTLAWIPLALPAGLGLLTALAGDDSRGLHDRVAGTRVLRVAA
jgi:uncharacterized RDD family membrane protein YckC